MGLIFIARYPGFTDRFLLLTCFSARSPKLASMVLTGSDKFDSTLSSDAKE